MKRVKWLDICKGIGMLLVVLGHVLTTPVRQSWKIGLNIYVLVYFFHMPLMFYISGVAYKIVANKYLKKDTISFTLKKARTLLVPYIIYNIAVFVIFFIANIVDAISNILTPAGYGRMGILTFAKGMLKGDNPYAFHMWYIYAMFIMSMLVFLIEKLCQRNFSYEVGSKVSFVILFIISFCLVVTRFYVNTANFGVLNETMEFFIWFVLGRYIDTEKLVNMIAIKIFSILSIIYMVIIVLSPELLYSRISYRVLDYISLIARFGMVLAFIIIAKLIVKIFVKDNDKENDDNNERVKNPIYRFLNFTGKNSFYIYMFHQPFFGSGTGMVIMKVVSNPIVSVVISFVMCYIVPICIIIFKEKYIDKKAEENFEG